MSVEREYKTFLLSEKDQDAILNLVDQTYIDREPLSIGLHCTYEDLQPLFKDIVKTALESHASLGITKKDSGELVGIMLNYVITSPDAVLFASGGYSTEKSNLYSKVIADFCYGVNVMKDQGAKKQIEMLIMLVHPDHSGKGLGKKLIQLSEEKGRELGCDIVTVQATNCITDIMVKKRGYKEVHKMHLSTFKSEDGQPLLDLPAMGETTSFTYLWKRLD